MWSTKYLLVKDDRVVLVWYHIPNHCTFKSQLRLYKRVVIPKKIIKVRELPLFFSLFVKFYKRPWRAKVKQSGGSIINPSETRPRAMNSI